MSKWTLGIIGGSGLYEIDDLEDRREEQVETAWGKPSGRATEEVTASRRPRCLTAPTLLH